LKPIWVIAGSILAVSIIGTAIASRDSMMAYPLSGQEQASPQDRVPYGLTIPGSVEIRIADTNSMDPVLDAEDTALGITVDSPDNIYVGDIITYRDGGGNLIIHRVIQIGEDGGGWFAITKGDNNDFQDPPIRWSQVDRVVVGVLY